jgi:hypothetical protein
LTDTVIFPHQSRTSLPKIAAAGVLTGILTPLFQPVVDKIAGAPGERHPSSRIVIVNTHKPLIDALKSEFGGNISPMKPTLGTKAYYRWCLAGKKCEELARQLQPFLIVKSEQVKQVLDY